MRIVAWNCRSGTDSKIAAAVELFDPEVLVVPESSRVPAVTATTLLASGIPHAWVGSIESKGLGVFAPKAAQLDVLPTEEGAGDWSLPVLVHGEREVAVLGVWTVPGGTGHWRSRYLRSLDGIFQRHDRLLTAGDAVVAGDFNCSGRSDGQLLEFLTRVHDTYGLVSAYHQWSGEAVGAETQMTHWWQGSVERPFHIDFVLVPATWSIDHVSVGSYDEWGAPGVPVRSDHGPLIVDVAPHQR